ncbi:hypothetical protein [Mesorhizobium sp. 10J20-29]
MSRILAAQSEDVARQLVGLGPKLAMVLDGGDPGQSVAFLAVMGEPNPAFDAKPEDLQDRSRAAQGRILRFAARAWRRDARRRVD